MSGDDKEPLTSTTWEWRKVKMRRSAGGQDTAASGTRGFRRLRRYPRTEQVRITVEYRGGAESWWLLKARGTQEVFPGHRALEDVLSRVYSER